MKTKAAVLWGLHQKWEVEEVGLDGPKENEVLVKLTAARRSRGPDWSHTNTYPSNETVPPANETFATAWRTSGIQLWRNPTQPRSWTGSPCPGSRLPHR